MVCASPPTKRSLAGSAIVHRFPEARKADDAKVAPLLELELSAKRRWVGRLEKIALKAGENAEINDDGDDHAGLSTSEKAKLRQIVFAMGAFRTLSCHIRHWERFDAWCSGLGLSCYPPTIEVVLKYALWLDSRECGPTVITSVRAAIAWMCSKIRMNAPDLKDDKLKAIEMRTIEIRGKEVREAVPIPLRLVGALELLMFKLIDPSPQGGGLRRMDPMRDLRLAQV